MYFIFRHSLRPSLKAKVLFIKVHFLDCLVLFHLEKKMRQLESNQLPFDNEINTPTINLTQNFHCNGQ